MVKSRKYNNLLPSTEPLIVGKIPYYKEISKDIHFNVVTPDGHVLSEKEWMVVVGDNILLLRTKPKQKSQYDIKDLKFIKIVDEKVETF